MIWLGLSRTGENVVTAGSSENGLRSGTTGVPVGLEAAALSVDATRAFFAAGSFGVGGGEEETGAADSVRLSNAGRNKSDGDSSLRLFRRDGAEILGSLDPPALRSANCSRSSACPMKSEKLCASFELEIRGSEGRASSMYGQRSAMSGWGVVITARF